MKTQKSKNNPRGDSQQTKDYQRKPSCEATIITLEKSKGNFKTYNKVVSIQNNPVAKPAECEDFPTSLGNCALLISKDLLRKIPDYYPDVIHALIGKTQLFQEVQVRLLKNFTPSDYNLWPDISSEVLSGKRIMQAVFETVLTDPPSCWHDALINRLVGYGKTLKRNYKSKAWKRQRKEKVHDFGEEEILANNLPPLEEIIERESEELAEQTRSANKEKVRQAVGCMTGWLQEEGVPNEASAGK